MNVMFEFVRNDSNMIKDAAHQFAPDRKDFVDVLQNEVTGFPDAFDFVSNFPQLRFFLGDFQKEFAVAHDDVDVGFQVVPDLAQQKILPSGIHEPRARRSFSPKAF